MSFRRICTTTINGKKWEIGFGFPGKTKGKVDQGVANYTRRRIVLHSKKKGRKCTIIDLAVHELLHAAVPALKEEVVNDFGELVARVLPKLMAAEADK